MIYATLRVQRKTLAALNAYRDRLQVQVNSDHIRFNHFGPSFRVSLGDAIDYLLGQQALHAARSRKSFKAGGRAKDECIPYDNDNDNGQG
jgi:hypothetical protein